MERIEILPNLANGFGLEYGQQIAQLVDKEILHQQALTGMPISVPASIFEQ